MKPFKRLFAFFAAFLIMLSPAASAASVTAHAEAESRAECVIEVSSRRFLSEHNAEKRLPMASTTKILTAILILDDCDITKTVTVPKEAEGTEGSSVYLRAGEQYTVLDLLYGLMLRSGNDCAVTLALHHSGSIAAFSREMTKKAAMLGAERSYFINPHGLPDSRHYTTAHDLALISSYAMENERFVEIVSTQYYGKYHWKNKNKMLWEYEGAIGVKTGFTVNAGRCLVSAARRNGMCLVCVVLNSPQMFARSKQLFDEAFLNYSLVTLAEEGMYDGYLAKYRFSYPLTEEEQQLVRRVIVPAQNDFPAQMQIYLKNNLLFSQNLYMIDSET